MRIYTTDTLHIYIDGVRTYAEKHIKMNSHSCIAKLSRFFLL